MVENSKNTRIISNLILDDHLEVWFENFISSCKIEGKSPGTVKFYSEKFGLFMRFCEGQVITRIGQIDAQTLRAYLLWLEATKHNPGGRHAAYRTLRVFIRWWIRETEPESWGDPFRKVKAPRLDQKIIDPVSIETVKAMVNTCDTSKLTGARDKALLLFLLDTGARARELLSMNVGDVNSNTGEVLIKLGKNHKPRSVFIGKGARKALRVYLKLRKDQNPALWIITTGEGFQYGGLRTMLRDRSKTAGVPMPAPHDFRRAFALNMLRAGVDIFTLQKFMGHAGLTVLRRYLAQTTADLAAAHRKGSPVDMNHL